MPRIDLTGKRFNKLIVTGYAGGRKWHCLCDCGKQKDIYYQHLVSGTTTSCGCNRKGVNANDLTNQSYGLLTALYPTDKRCGNSIVWRCACKCGNTCDVSAMSLRNGTTTSCGCYSSAVHSKSISTAKNERNKYYDCNTDMLNLPINKAPANNTSGCRGVSFDTTTQLWVAKMAFRGKTYFLGSSRNKDIVIQIRKEAESKIYDFVHWYTDQRKEFKSVLERKYHVKNTLPE